ncbi:hypothetical protein ACQI5H_22820 [Mycobacterium heidelbergense]|uniref:8-oxoguanine DNA glycosylase OGG fold protein n=1 Tax=Mycobacterium heidelbergense TaxID=53376 RepID=UPI003CEB3356
MERDVPLVLTEVLATQPLPQRAFRWSPAGWRKEMHDLPEALQVLDRLPERVDRSTVREVVLAELGCGRVLSAFVGAMVWGYGDAGYGATRVRWVLTGIRPGAHNAPVRGDVAGLLDKAAEVVRAQGPVEGFRYMNNTGRIKYLASAFFTKWLYFASALTSADDPNAAPILDMQVRNWLEKYAGVSLELGRTSDYQRYFEALTTWGEKYGRTPVQVEKAIFGLATGRA